MPTTQTHCLIKTFTILIKRYRNIVFILLPHPRSIADYFFFPQLTKWTKTKLERMKRRMKFHFNILHFLQYPVLNWGENQKNQLQRKECHEVFVFLLYFSINRLSLNQWQFGCRVTLSLESMDAHTFILRFPSSLAKLFYKNIQKLMKNCYASTVWSDWIIKHNICYANIYSLQSPVLNHWWIWGIDFFRIFSLSLYLIHFHCCLIIISYFCHRFQWRIDRK